MASEKARMYICTLNNPDVVMCEDYLKNWHTKGGAVFVTGQLEKGESGTVHLQYFVQFTTQKRISALRKICPKSHFECVKANNGADTYCNKDDTRIDGPWTFGIKPARLNL